MIDYTALRNCELFLFDMDGTLYLGDDVYDGAIALMEDLPRLGKKYIYLTNNSSRAGTDYITRLRRLGFPCEAENVFTSGMATGQYLNQQHPGAKVYLAGTRAFYRELTSYGIDLVNDENGHTEADTVDVVVQGFDTELVYEKLDKACHFLRRGAAFIAANPDWVCPMPHDEVLPDCGSICALLLHRQAQPEHDRRHLRHDRHSQREALRRGRPAVYGHRRGPERGLGLGAGALGRDDPGHAGRRRAQAQLRAPLRQGAARSVDVKA